MQGAGPQVLPAVLPIGAHRRASARKAGAANRIIHALAIVTTRAAGRPRASARTLASQRRRSGAWRQGRLQRPRGSLFAVWAAAGNSRRGQIALQWRRDGSL